MELELVRKLAGAALQNLEANRRRIDDLNVYPVPDGDTGTNLVLTLRSVVEALAASTATTSEEVARDVTRAALMGARGNSGVIFSQIVRGFVGELGRTDAVSTAVLRRAFRGASDAAYRAVKRPVEGTMLTVIREMAEEAERREHRRASPEALLEAVLLRSEAALARTPELLDVLRSAGVVDAGGAGLVEITRGLVHGATGRELPPPPEASEGLTVDAIHQESSRYRYCTVFVVEGDGLDQPALEEQLEEFGDSLLVVGDASALKVHVHTDDPGAALSLGTRAGAIEGVEIADMHRQTARREERLLAELGADSSPLQTAVVVVAAGNGNRRLFESLGAARVIEGGQTMNPSTAEIVDAIDSVAAADVIVLPNNANVVLSAEQAAGLTSKAVHVVPSRSLQAGLAAMSRYLPTGSVDENVEAMNDALGAISTGEVTIASRDAEMGGVKIEKGAFLGLVEDEAVAANGDFAVVAGTVVDALLADDREHLSLVTGDGAPPLDGLVAALGERHPEVEFEVHEGGQPHYPLLLVAE
jgi:DAK2 domain fusion protein YloV